MEENNAIEQRKKINPLFIIGGIFLLGALGYVLVSSGKKDTVTEIPTMQTPTNQTTQIGSEGAKLNDVITTVVPAENVREFVVNGTSFAFSPKTITVKRGDTVKITFKDDDGMHDLVVDGYNVRTKVLRQGTEGTVTFIADKTGSFKYYCSVSNHEELGMVGTLVVE